MGNQKSKSQERKDTF